MPRRAIHDNVLIAHEVMHSMKARLRKNSWMAIKLDMEKVYDRVEWDFVLQNSFGLIRNRQVEQNNASRQHLFRLWSMTTRQSTSSRLEDLGKRTPYPHTFSSFAWRFLVRKLMKESSKRKSGLIFKVSVNGHISPTSSLQMTFLFFVKP